jgi:hypothetical protein
VWWEDVELVLKAVTPLYCVLRFADQQKNGTISGFIPRMLKAQREIFAKLKKGKVHFEEDEDLFEDGSDSDSPHGSPVYAESQDSSSASSDDEGDCELFVQINYSTCDFLFAVNNI